MKKEQSSTPLLLKGNTSIILVVLLVIASFLIGSLWTRTQFMEKEKQATGKVAGTEAGNPTNENPSPTEKPNFPTTVGNFLVTNKEICKENDKPIVYFFGSSSCPHCTWEKPIIQKAIQKFANQISYHENIDTEKDSDILQKYSDINPGYVPFLILGCKYARVGAGENLGKTPEESEKLEEEGLTTILCKLTGNKPDNICQPLQEKIKGVK